MLPSSRFAMILGLAGALAALPSLTATEKSDTGVAEAVRFEKAKQAAADRQARIEESRDRDANAANGSAPAGKTKNKTARQPKTKSASSKVPQK